MKITIQPAKNPAGVKFRDIPVGTVFRAYIITHSSDTHRPRGVYLRIYDKIVDLANPNSTWELAAYEAFEYEPLEAELICRPLEGREES